MSTRVSTPVSAPVSTPANTPMSTLAPASVHGERAIVFSCGQEQLVGIVHPAPADVGVVVVVGGPQYRAGSHRQFVLLARHLAAEGLPVLRFDVRGMGDSDGAQRNFESLSADVAAAIDALLVHQPQVRRVVLWGLCDGASAALLYLQASADVRVRGLVLVNPWVRSEASLARAHVKHYYRDRLLQPDFWRKLLSGGVALKAVSGLWDNLRKSRRTGGAVPSSFQHRMAGGWHSFGGPILLVLSGNDYTAREFQEYIRGDPAWAEALTRAALTVHDAVGADHTFSRAADRRALERVTSDWLKVLP